MKSVVVIGSGFAGLSTACFLAKAGLKVTVLEKHDAPGGRARSLTEQGFRFDMGPSWYWMPDVFESFFNSFGKSVSDYYSLLRLDPSYRVYFPDEAIDVPADYEALKAMFEDQEPGSATKLDQFLKEAAYKYERGINDLARTPSLSLKEFTDPKLLIDLLRLDVLMSMKKHLRKFFKEPKLLQLMEFPVLFLGALADKIPALYSLMNYADIKLGTWYPQGGMYKIIEGMHCLAVSLGVEFRFSATVTGFRFEGNRISGAEAGTDTGTAFFPADAVVAAADYHHAENLLPQHLRSYSKKYWYSRTMAPSCILYYVGLNRRLRNTMHHSLFFDTDFDKHGAEIYKDPKWPTAPLFYVSAVSKSDPEAAPAGHENLFFLIPVAAGLNGDTTALRDEYFDKIAARYEARIGENIREHIVYYRSYAGADFLNDYNAFKGNAYGLANTLKQTALLKPKMRSKKIKNLFYAGQLTVPGPGVPPALISGEIAAAEVVKFADNK